MFHVKICGVRRPEDVQAVSEAGCDAIGLNFYAPSVRYIDPRQESTRGLSQLASSLGLLRVGVFVNETASAIANIVERVGIDAVQLHGDEETDIVRHLSGIKIIRAIKLPLGELSVDSITRKTEPWLRAGCHLLLDADAGAAHGGSGKTLHWSSVSAWGTASPHAPWTLAGGLTAENVGEAVRASGATSVDTASGVEEPKGIKSAAKINDFAIRYYQAAQGTNNSDSP